MNKSENRIFYTKPAAKWTEALPLGNGRIGAMVYGDPNSECICLNEDTLWTGYPRDTNVYGSAGHLKDARKALENGDNLKAQEIIETKMLGEEGDSYLPLGDLLFDFHNSTDVTDYQRELDFSTGICSVEYTAGSTRYKREYFVSAPENAFMIHMSCGGKEKLSFDIKMRSQLRNDLLIEENLLILDADCPSDNEMRYEADESKRGVGLRAAVRVETENGIVSAKDGVLSVAGADSVLIYFTVRTSFNGYDKLPFLEGKEYKKACVNAVRSLPEIQHYEELKSAHIADFGGFYHRVVFSLDESGKTGIPTDERLKLFAGTKDDNGLFTLFFNFGRYLLISSSRPGCQPANLQGIWNADLRAAWKSNYTLNINVQMNYWPALVCGMPELHEPLLKMIEELSVPGRKTAGVQYDAPGFTAHHNTDLWRKTTPVCGKANHAFWNVSPAWLCLHLFEHYQFTQDMEFLRAKAYPLMKEAALFCVDLLSENAEGELRVSPATSPENFFVVDGELCAVADSATMTVSMLRCLFKNCLKAARILNRDHEFAEELTDILQKLKPYQIGSKGQLLEWDQEFEEYEIHHRHLSLLYGVFPGQNLLDMKDGSLLAACRKTLDRRGDEGSGWCTAWKIAIYARLLDPERAYDLFEKLFRSVESEEIDYSGGGGAYPNLFSAHPPFQIDGNFGTAAAIAEMLVQSHEDYIHILPALPKKWKSGEIKGLISRGNIKVDIKWENLSVKQIILTSGASQRVAVRYEDQRIVLDLMENTPYIIQK